MHISIMPLYTELCYVCVKTKLISYSEAYKLIISLLYEILESLEYLAV